MTHLKGGDVDGVGSVKKKSIGGFQRRITRSKYRVCLTAVKPDGAGRSEKKSIL